MPTLQIRIPNQKEQVCKNTMKQTDKNGNEFEVDDRVARLVTVLNMFPGIETFSSCGGHKNPQMGQKEYGRFCVGFDVERKRMRVAMNSLERIVWNIFEVAPLHARVEAVDLGGEDNPCLCFELRGCCPDVIAEALEAELKK
jgi:tRNA(Phe) wybutosine-synthesizing methylase Tyw3